MQKTDVIQEVGRDHNGLVYSPVKMSEVALGAFHEWRSGFSGVLSIYDVQDLAKSMGLHCNVYEDDADLNDVLSAFSSSLDVALTALQKALDEIDK